MIDPFTEIVGPFPKEQVGKVNYHIENDSSLLWLEIYPIH